MYAIFLCDYQHAICNSEFQAVRQFEMRSSKQVGHVYRYSVLNESFQVGVLVNRNLH